MVDAIPSVLAAVTATASEDTPLLALRGLIWTCCERGKPSGVALESSNVRISLLLKLSPRLAS